MINIIMLLFTIIIQLGIMLYVLHCDKLATINHDKILHQNVLYQALMLQDPWSVQVWCHQNLDMRYSRQIKIWYFLLAEERNKQKKCFLTLVGPAFPSGAHCASMFCCCFCQCLTWNHPPPNPLCDGII